MTNKRFCFILHIENEAIAQIAIESIQELSVPEGYTIDLITVKNTDNTVMAYAEAARQCDAEYQVYLREHAAILNARFLFDVLAAFEKNKRIGVLGVVGCTALLPSTKVEHGLWKNSGLVGSKLLVTGESEAVVRYASGLADVKAISDSLVVVRGDVATFNPAYTRAHHAVLQLALDALQNGYRVVVPAQASPWIAVCDIENAKDQECFPAEKALFLKNNKDAFPPVSVGVPTYNRPDWLVDTINSVLNQSYPNMLAFITDNSRNEETAKRIEALFSNDPRVNYEHNSDNIGAYNNFDKVYHKIDTEYCTIITDDMWLELDAIERAMDYYVLDGGCKISVITGHNRSVRHADGATRIYGNMDKEFLVDTVQSGACWARLNAVLNMTIFSFCSLFRKSKLTVPFGYFGERKGFANFDRYVGYELHKVGLGVYLASVFSCSWTHSEQLEWRPEYRIGGGNDYAHEVIESRKCGFLTNDTDYLKALREVANYYNNFTLHYEVIGNLPEEHKNLLDEAYMFMRKLDSETKRLTVVKK